MAKKGKGKGKGKGEANPYAVKFVPMPRTWPGKISNPDLFNEFAQKVRSTINANKAYPIINLRIKQLGFERYHDFIITVSKSMTIFNLQCEIARIQHGGSVHPENIIIFKGKANTPAEKLLENAQGTILQDDLSIGIPQEMICNDDTQTLIHYFPDMSTISQKPIFLHEIQCKEYPQRQSTKTKCYEEIIEEPIPSKPILMKNVAEYEAKNYYDLWYDILPYIKIKPFKKDFKIEDFHHTDWLSSEVHNQHPPLPFKARKFDFNCSLLKGHDYFLKPRESINNSKEKVYFFE